MPKKNAVTEETLGAWVIKCNPTTVWDLRGFVADGKSLIEGWSVVENYRSAMMRRGQQVLLWVTGSEGGPLPRGFWGPGWITGTADYGSPDDYWIDEEARARNRFFVPLRVIVWDKPVTEAALRAVDGLDDIEVIRRRQAANPNWVSTEQLALLKINFDQLARWPSLPAPPST